MRLDELRLFVAVFVALSSFASTVYFETCLLQGPRTVDNYFPKSRADPERNGGRSLHTWRTGWIFCDNHHLHR